ncbi:TRAP transporter substrate-binding protein [Sporosarcina siberiensis]|uniref:TRAP transporter substrate-binding protein n=1 Tax=Sporosarcina siberiensis TaxID=1365606 RepID=A0ABW4SJM1_9BACL
MKFINLKKIFSLTALSLALLLTGCSDSDDKAGADDKEKVYELSLGHEVSQSHSWHVTASEFAEAVKEESDGRLDIVIFPDGTLGGATAMLEQIQIGDLDMAITGGPSHAPIVPEMSIQNLPFLYDDREKAYEAVDGELGDLQFGLLKEKGILGLAWWEDGFFQVTTNTGPIETPEDLEGVKIRVPEIKLRQDIFKELGANPVPMSFTELFTGLQQKAVDGQTNGLNTIYDSNFYEVQDYLSILNITWSPAVLEIGLDKFNSLPEDLQKILKDNAIKYRDIQRKRTQEEDTDLIQKLEEKGMKVNVVDDLTPFIEKSKPVFEKYKDVFGEELMDLILED